MWYVSCASSTSSPCRCSPYNYPLACPSIRARDINERSCANGSHVALCAAECMHLSVDISLAEAAAPAPPSSAPAPARLTTAALYRHRSGSGASRHMSPHLLSLNGAQAADEMVGREPHVFEPLAGQGRSAMRLQPVLNRRPLVRLAIRGDDRVEHQHERDWAAELLLNRLRRWRLVRRRRRWRRQRER